MLNLFNQYSLEEIIIFVILLLFALKELFQLKDFFSGRMQLAVEKQQIMDKYDKVIQGRLISKRSSKGYTGRKLLTLSANIKFSYSGLTRNYDVTNADFGPFLQLGDSIYKPPYSDSIFVYRSNTEYFFILGKYISINSEYDSLFISITFSEFVSNEFNLADKNYKVTFFKQNKDKILL